MNDNRAWTRSSVGARVGAVLALGASLVTVGTAQAQESSVLVTAEWVAERLDDLVVISIHYRMDGYTEAHIPGSQFVGWGEFVSNDDPGAEMKSVTEMADVFASAGVGNDRHVVLYSPQPIPAARGFLTLEYLGHERVHVLDGGLDAWTGAGYETESGEEPEAPPGMFTPHVRQDILVDSDWVLANLETPGITLIDARPDNEYTGEGVDPDNEMGMKPGHVPGANQIYYTDLVRSEEDLRYLDMEDLVARFQKANAKPGDTLVSYCMVGMRASVTYMISRHLGFDARFYDGSWHDWSAKDLPVVEGTEPGGH